MLAVAIDGHAGQAIALGVHDAHRFHVGGDHPLAQRDRFAHSAGHEPRADRLARVAGHHPHRDDRPLFIQAPAHELAGRVEEIDGVPGALAQLPGAESLPVNPRVSGANPRRDIIWKTYGRPPNHGSARPGWFGGLAGLAGRASPTASVADVDLPANLVLFRI